MHNWQTIPIMNADNYPIPEGHDPARIRALAEYIGTGSMLPVIFAHPEPGQEDLEAWQWGPAADSIDWAGWPACDTCSSPASWREVWQTDLMPGSAFLYACREHRTERMHPLGAS